MLCCVTQRHTRTCARTQRVSETGEEKDKRCERARRRENDRKSARKNRDIKQRQTHTMYYQNTCNHTNALTLQYTRKCYCNNTLKQHAATTRCKTLCYMSKGHLVAASAHHTTTHCNTTLQDHTSTHLATCVRGIWLQHPRITLHHNATHCITLQHQTATTQNNNLDT